MEPLCSNEPQILFGHT